MAPAIGSPMSVLKMGNAISTGSTQDHDDAQKERTRIGAHRAGLDTAKDEREPSEQVADTVDGPVDAAGVHALPEPLFGHDLHRLQDRGVVDLVDVVLVQQDAVQPGEPLGHSGRRVAPPQEEEHRQADAARGHCSRHPGQYQLQPLGFVRGPGVMVADRRLRLGGA